MKYSCGSLNENGSHKLRYLNVFFSQLVDYLGRAKRCGLVGKCVSLGIRFEVSKAIITSVFDLSHFDWCKLESQVSFDFHFPDQ